MATKSMEDLFIDSIRDLLNAEKQIIEALPSMIDAASSPELKEALDEHLEETREHRTRLETILKAAGHRANDETCKGMEGLLEEGEEVLEEDFESYVMDAAIIGAAQKVEHYEICGYGTAKAFAEELGEEDAVELLERTLEEEKRADQTLTEIAEAAVNSRASGEEESEGEEPRKARRQPSVRRSRAMGKETV
jgi:ferritin-like metal-binding protein YciE